MKIVDVIKSLSNQTRLNILSWLKDPFAHFPKEELSNYDPLLGVCVSDIAQKAGVSIPTISDYLKTLSSVNLLTATRKGQWTYYKRNEETIKEFTQLIKDEL